VVLSWYPCAAAHYYSPYFYCQYNFRVVEGDKDRLQGWRAVELENDVALGWNEVDVVEAVREKKKGKEELPVQLGNSSAP